MNILATNMLGWKCRVRGTGGDVGFNLVMAVLFVQPITGQLMCACLEARGGGSVHTFDDLIFEAKP